MSATVVITGAFSYTGKYTTRLLLGGGYDCFDPCGWMGCGRCRAYLGGIQGTHEQPACAGGALSRPNPVEPMARG
jgi:hypothetical protein